MAMRLMGEQFVTGETISEALANSRKYEARGFRYSYDMLGEAATTEEDAQLLRVVRTGDPRDRQGGRRPRYLKAGHLDQAVRAAHATRARSRTAR